ncbi:AraC family transcriptional regulator [Polaribacter sp. Q13]|uniref:helix-turn-helix domain-containing protein n=1 Tax=Polaribacter sp. Q13 TaxID=2806551 RepID=UPI00193C1548|nr:helix-turn-helix domain-containing protein [Polaribacter sp. Q13]QVY64618.1 AraC family transcriptional regulator [Polaribacter sp. Q13]
MSLLYYPDSLSIKFADSLIFLSKEKHFRYTSFGHNIKGNISYEFGDFRNALNEYIIASELAKKYNNHFQYLTLKFNIGLLKNNLGERKEALDIFKDYLSYVEKIRDKNPKNYIRGLFAMADSYIYSQEIDTAEVYIKKGIHATLVHKDKYHYEHFVFLSGISNYFKKDYINAIDSLVKAKKTFSLNDFEQTRLSICNYYLGKSLYNLNKRKESLKYFKAVDSILQINNDVSIELIDSYNYLIADAKKNKNLKSQIRYINSFIKFDSILDINYKYIKSTLVKNYETPELIFEKERIITQLSKENKGSKSMIIVINSILCTLILLTTYIFRRNLIYKKRFKEIINRVSLENENTINNQLIKASSSSSSTGLPEELIKEILLALDKFEKSSKYLTKKYTLNTLAKELKTNSSYLSKVINVTKKMNFSNYLNNLKIDYAIKRLTKEKKFRSYTIKAIALESGFNNAQSFSVAFHTRTNLYPSYFIKELNTI